MARVKSHNHGSIPWWLTASLGLAAVFGVCLACVSLAHFITQADNLVFYIKLCVVGTIVSTILAVLALLANVFQTIIEAERSEMESERFE